MDGKILLYQLRQLLEENATSSFLDERTSYDFLYEAAIEYARITRCLTGTQTITTTASTSSYDLNDDYLYMYAGTDRNEYWLKYYDGNGTYYPTWRDYDAIAFNNNSNATDIPSNFSIVDTALADNIGSTATSTNAAVLGECNLIDTTQAFLSTASAGDTVHNIDDASDGIVLQVVSNSALNVALFGGTNNYFTAGDDYVVVPQGRKILAVDPPSLTAGHTITFSYIAKPMPVYAQTRRYRFDATAMPAIVKYAAWLYKYRDREPNVGDRWYQYWDQSVRKNLSYTNKSLNRNSFKVNYNKRTLIDRSYR
jgi:hypothetical protein